MRVMRRATPLWVFLLVCIVTPAGARRARLEVFSALVVAVSDGDTIVVRHGNKNLRVRLAEVDCPEPQQPYGQDARAFTARMVLDKVVRVEPKTVDEYDRLVAHVRLSDGRDLGEELLQQGLAWWYRRYSRDRRLESLEAAARQAKRGLWADPDPVPPWLYRRMRPLFR